MANKDYVLKDEGIRAYSAKILEVLAEEGVDSLESLGSKVPFIFHVPRTYARICFLQSSGLYSLNGKSKNVPTYSIKLIFNPADVIIDARVGQKNEIGEIIVRTVESLERFGYKCIDSSVGKELGKRYQRTLEPSFDAVKAEFERLKTFR